MAQLKSVGPMSVMKVCAVMYALFGLIAGAIVSLIAMMGSAASSELGAFGALMGVGAIIALPIFYGVIGAIGGAISALIYNFCAKFTGGIEMELG